MGATKDIYISRPPEYKNVMSVSTYLINYVYFDVERNFGLILIRVVMKLGRITHLPVVRILVAHLCRPAV